MKTVRKTILLLIIFLIAAYFSPFMFADEGTDSIALPKEATNEPDKEASEMEMVPLDQSLVPTTGFANYVGMAVDDFMVEFGGPEEVKELSETEEMWIYGSDSSDFVQLTVIDYVITEILVLGSEVNINPFEMGMERNELFQVASFHPTFEVPFEGQTVQIKLNETELNNQPLLAFDNATFAMLTIDSKTDTLIGVQYMTNETLVQSDLYEKNAFSSVVEEEPVKVNQAVQEKWQAESMVQYINIMRRKMDLEPFKYSLVLTAFGNELYDYHNQLKTEQQAESSAVNSGAPRDSSDDSLVINEEETGVQKIEGSSEADLSEGQEEDVEAGLLNETLIEDFLKQQNVSLEQVRLMYQPVQSKTSYYTLRWFTMTDYRDILMDSKMKRIGISFRGDELLLILDDGSEIQL